MTEFVENALLISIPIVLGALVKLYEDQRRIKRVREKDADNEKKLTAALDKEKERRDEEIKRVKAETQNFISQQYLELIGELKEEREYDREQINLNKEAAKKAQQQNDDCEFEHSITRLQLDKVLKRLNMTDWVKSTVFVLDDSKPITDIFIHRFRTIPVVNFRAFQDWDLFLSEVKREKPEVLVIDHGEIKVEDLIKEIGYPPEILVMSGTKENETYYKGTDIRFFYKDQFLIKNITKTILEHLTTKNRAN